MAIIARRAAGRGRDMRISLRAGTAVAALVLSSCSAIGLTEEPEAESQTALATGAWNRAAGQPLQLGPTMAIDWVDQIDPATTADPPALLASLDAPGSALEIAAVLPAVRNGAETVGPIWTGLSLNTVSLEGLALADRPVEEALPLLVADGRYHWPSATGTGVPSETPCFRNAGIEVAQVDCAEWSDQIALAPTTVDDAMLADQRGGFITVGGLQIDIGIRVETLVNGVTQLTTALTLDDVINGGLEGIQIGQVTIGSGDAATDIIHNVGLGNVNTVISNSQDDVDISTLATLAIDVINLQQPQIGNSFGATGRMSPELQQSIVRGIGP